MNNAPPRLSYSPEPKTEDELSSDEVPVKAGKLNLREQGALLEILDDDRLTPDQRERKWNKAFRSRPWDLERLQEKKAKLVEDGVMLTALDQRIKDVEDQDGWLPTQNLILLTIFEREGLTLHEREKEFNRQNEYFRAIPTNQLTISDLYARYTALMEIGLTAPLSLKKARQDREAGKNTYKWWWEIGCRLNGID